MIELNFQNVFKIKKEREYKLYVPILLENQIFKLGIYLWKYKGKVIKVGIFGEGVNSNSKTRYATYRTAGRNLYGYIFKNLTPNGSVKPMRVLNKKMKTGEKIEVEFAQIPNKVIWKDNLPFKVDLYALEEYYKQKYKDTLWLN